MRSPVGLARLSKSIQARIQGKTYTGLRATNGPSPRYGLSMDYDNERGSVVMFGGNSSWSW